MEENIAGVDLESLEARVLQATRVIQQLKSERDTLRKSVADLETQLRGAETQARGVVDEWKARAQEAEVRLERFAQERSSLARRVEQMLEKLRAVEEEQLGAPATS